MTLEERERMNLLCIGIQEERDYEKFAALLREMSELIDRKEQRRFKDHPKLVWQRTRPWMKVSAIVRRIVKPMYPTEPEKVEISMEAGDELFREIRIPNRLTTVDGHWVALRGGVPVDITFEAEVNDTRELTT